MIDQNNIETLFDCFDESATLLYTTYKTSYIDGLIITCENIMANSVEDKYKEIRSELERYLEKISKIQFAKEEIRKAFQYACLRGFKHANISNQMITPDTLGIFINYLLSKLYIKKDLIILDPLVGTGNLITTIANNADGNHSLIGVDNDEDMYRLASALFDLLDYGDWVYCQDTTSFTGPTADCIATDFSDIETEEIYRIISYHEKNIIAGGFLVGVVNSEVVLPETLISHSQGLNQVWKLFGLIGLPDNIAKNQKKSIVIFQKAGENVMQPTKFLLADLPDFNEKDGMMKVINQLNDWFRNTEYFRI